MGGMLRAIETGYVQREIQESAYRYQRAIESQEEIVVGMNRFQIETERRCRCCGSMLRSNRRKSNGCARCVSAAIRQLSSLNKLEQAAATTENLLPPILECVESYATVGEISNRLRRVWGEYRETSTL